MDPYLESHWGDVHTRLMVYASNQLNPQLPENLQARVEEGLAVTEGHTATRTVYPDIQIVEEPGVPGDFKAAGALAVPEPYVIELDDEPRTQRHLEIVDLKQGGRIITVIEILSPANKVGATGQLAYVRKQREYLDAGVNLVEIDLIRTGNFVLAVPAERLPPACRTPYLISIRRAIRPGRAEVYPVPLRQPLPNIPVPLRLTDRDVVLQMQPLLDDCYRDGRYDRIDYRGELVPRLGEADARWADALLREKGLR